MYLIRLRFVKSLQTYDDRIANVLDLNSYRLYPLNKLPLVFVEIREAGTLDNTGHLDEISSGPAKGIRLVIWGYLQMGARLRKTTYSAIAFLTGSKS